MKPAIRRVVLLALATLLIAAFAFGADENALLGKWNMVSESSDGSLQWVLNVKQTDGKLSATLNSDNGDAAVEGFTYENGVVRFKAPYQGELYDIELKLADSKLEGTWSGGGSSGRTYGTKA
jgi:hypothetical protein